MGLLDRDRSRGERDSSPGCSRSSPARRSSLFSLSDEVQILIASCLPGREAGRLAATASCAAETIREDRLWQHYLRQEFPAALGVDFGVTSRASSTSLGSRGGAGAADGEGEGNSEGEEEEKKPAGGEEKRTEKSGEEAALTTYKFLHRLPKNDALRWRFVPSDHDLGEREGSPGMFSFCGWLFVFGGWGHGPQQDLHAARLGQDRLLFEEVDINTDVTAPPRPSYESKVTLLLDQDTDSEEALLSRRPLEEGETFRAKVLVSGGFLHGGYRNSFGGFGIFEITVTGGADGRVLAQWLHVGAMEPRSNHSATFIPPRIAGEEHFPEGYLLVVGGNSQGRATRDLAILDLRSLVWNGPLDDITTGAQPKPRNSHSATLLRYSPKPGSEAPGNFRYGVLVVGGGDGDGTNGSPPHGGSDLEDAWWILGLESGGTMLKWAEAAQWENAGGRGHVGVRLGPTNSVLVWSGGNPSATSAIVLQDDTCHFASLASSPGPIPRAFGASCCLPDGTIVLYGGWHPSGRAFRDFWFGYLGDEAPPTVARLPVLAAPANRRHPEQPAPPAVSLDARILRQLLRARSGALPPR